jgi:hypothetical protein
LALTPRPSPLFNVLRSEAMIGLTWVRADSLSANYPYKYFGKGQGVSAYTFRDERDLLWYSVVLGLGNNGTAKTVLGTYRFRYAPSYRQSGSDRLAGGPIFIATNYLLFSGTGH